MANTSSIAFPFLFDVTGNKVSVLKDKQSVVNRTRLLILTEPTELHYNPTFGVGLKQYMFQYNTKNTKAIIHNRIIDQLREHEPCVDADNTSFVDDLLFTMDSDKQSAIQEYNQLKMTVGLKTIFGDTADVEINNGQ